MIKVKKDNTKSILSAIRNLSSNRVFVGIPEEKGQRKKGQIGNATLAFIQSAGSPAHNLPARPFLIPGVKSKQKEYVKILKKFGSLALTDKNAAKKGLNAVGLTAQSAVKAYIKKSDHFDPLSQSTLKQRKSKGFRGEKPLIRTGQLINSISYVIRSK